MYIKKGATLDHGCKCEILHLSFAYKFHVTRHVITEVWIRGDESNISRQLTCDYSYTYTLDWRTIKYYFRSQKNVAQGTEEKLLSIIFKSYPFLIRYHIWNITSAVTSDIDFFSFEAPFLNSYALFNNVLLIIFAF